jgi:peptidoglycan hydrolase-like protein with peptidoglycan-binding domain
MIPTTSASVNIDGLHPRFRARLEAFFADPRITNLARGHRVKVVSATRTYAQQKHLYDGWVSRRRGYNLAANPDRRLASGFQGSYHMAQPAFEGYGYAVDFRQIDKTLSTWEINSIAAEYGIVAVIQSKEWWHHQPCKVVNGKLEWFPAPKLDEPAKAVNSGRVDLKAIAAFLADCAKTTVRKGDKGIVVKAMQGLLEQQGYQLTSRPSARSGADGNFGRLSERAVKQFQKDEGLTADGVCGPKTWASLLD